MSDKSSGRLRCNDFVDEVMRLAPPRGSELVIIAGSRNLDVLLGLTRRGFGQLACLEPGAPRAGEAADVLLVPHAETQGNLSRTLTQLGQGLLQGGTLIVQVAGRGARLLAKSLRNWLAANGYTPLRQVPLGSGFVLSARKRIAARAAQVA